MRDVHMTGAAMTIGCGIIYMYIQTVLSYKMDDSLTRSRVRLSMAIISTVAATSCILQWKYGEFPMIV